MARHKEYSGRSVVGIFKDRNAAERAIDSLLNAGFDRDHVSVVMKGAEESKRFAQEAGVQETQAGKGAAAGAGIGAALGGAAGVLAGLGALAIPGIGPVLAAGPIAAGLAGALGGGALGGIAGGLVGMGIPEEEAKLYEEDVKAGNILVAVECGDRCDSAKSVLMNAGAINYGRPQTMGGTRPAPEAYGEQRRTTEPYGERTVPPEEEGRYHIRR